MEYTVVELEEKTVVGLTDVTLNSDPNMLQVIGQLWYKFYNDNVYQGIANKKNSHTIALYSDYESDKDGKYNITVCCEVTEAINLDLCIKKIDSGKYAKFVVNGNIQTAVNEFWQMLWQMPLNRKYSTDFEEYVNVDKNGDGQINIYISII